ncbi:hypothetical protein [Streptomyces sp. NPDC045251]|uniref:hypothetical protein n=1 Tax=unclassified Streptomyces TaxID=2593676 RepID=UPI0033E58DD7
MEHRPGAPSSWPGERAVSTTSPTTCARRQPRRWRRSWQTLRPRDLARIAERAAGEDIGFLLNSAEINGYVPFAELEPPLLRKVLDVNVLDVNVLDVNVLAVTVLTHAAVPAMRAASRRTARHTYTDDIALLLLRNQ